MSKKKKSLKYKLEITWSEEDGAWVVNVPELPGCATHGDTAEEAVAMAHEAIEGYIETLRKMGKPIPPPLAERPFSGKIALRIDPNLHRDIALMAESQKLSVNTFIADRLRKAAALRHS